MYFDRFDYLCHSAVAPYIFVGWLVFPLSKYMLGYCRIILIYITGSYAAMLMPILDYTVQAIKQL